MINLLLHWVGDFNQLIEDNKFPFYISFAEVNEMTDDVYLVIVKEPDNFDSIELAMEALNDVLVIGTYNQDGSQYLWGNEVSRNHTTNKYHARLRNHITYDEEGNILTDLPYTLEESKSVQVNRFYGWTPRNLN